MELQTKIHLEPRSENPIDHHSKVLLLGSCFVENIGNQLNYFKFQNLQNPFGVLFNPVVMDRLIESAIERKVYNEHDVFYMNDHWHCFDVHSKLSSNSKEAVINKLNESLAITHDWLKEASHIIITLGTAWVYKNIKSSNIVANCHKVPQKEFKKELLSIETIYKSLESLVANIRKVNPDTEIIFTISPVRHLKDGFVENTHSKSHLISALHAFLSKQDERKTVSYFPSYEIMMDELRDYRFYEEDMVHPNHTAINYIWQKFRDLWISADSYVVMDEIESIQKGLAHKPFNPESADYKKHHERLRSKQEALRKQFPRIVF
ncbi:MAG: GSCFA domain-containing protein [Flavobacteriaceae bacterium]|nr:GSCFA domain-containing protein [Flavobacteriaceae bacterium]